MGASSSQPMGSSRPTSCRALQVAAPSKWQLAWRATEQFVKATFNGQDGFGIGCFSGDKYISNEGWFCNGEADALRAIVHCRASVRPDDGTMLFDAIPLAVRQFWQHGNRQRPWLLIILTDGQDNMSGGTAWSAGQFLLNNFNHIQDNFVFVVGVGPEAEVDMAALRTMGAAGRFPAVHVRDFGLLERAFALIALRVVAGEQVVAQLQCEQDTTRLWAQVRRFTALHRQPLDCMVLMDASGSMNERAW